MPSFSTGMKVLDDLLGGGIPCGVITTIYGDADSGKTTLTMIAAAQAIKQNRSVFLCYTEDMFSEERFKQITDAAGIDFAEMRSSLFNYKTATSMGNQVKAVKGWVQEAEMFNKMGKKPGLFIIDSISRHYHDALSKVPAEHLAGTARMLIGKIVAQTEVLGQLAIEYGCPALAITWTKSGAGQRFSRQERQDMMQSGELYDLELGLGSKTYDFIGGRNLEYTSKVIIHALPFRGSERIALLEKHPYMPTERLVRLKLTAAGFEAVNGEVHELDEFWQTKIDEAEAERRRKKQGGQGKPREQLAAS